VAVVSEVLVLVSEVLRRGELLAREKAFTFAFSRRRRDERRLVAIVVNFIVACLLACLVTTVLYCLY